MTDIYIDSTVGSSGDGSTWAQAFKTIAEATIVNGDTVYLNAPQAMPLRESVALSGLQDVQFRCDQGSNGEAWITDGRKSNSWIDAGGGIFTLALAAKPTHVVYDFKQDDQVGTKTGCDFTSPRIQQAIQRFGLTTRESQLYPFYGFLRENTGTPTTPAVGEWGYSAGTLYVNPAASVTLQDVKDLCEYTPGGVSAAILFTNATNCQVLTGLVGRLFPDQMSNGGYIVRFDGAGAGDGNQIVGCRAYASGWHSFGHVSDADDGRLIQDCISVGCTGDELGSASQDPVAETVAVNNTYNHNVRNFVTIGVPRFDTAGVPVKLSNVPSLGISHTQGAGTQYDGLHYDNCLYIDFHSQIEAKHSLGAMSTTNGQVSHGGGTLPTDPTDFAQYRNTCTNSWFLGRCIHTMSPVGYRYCLMDRTVGGEDPLDGRAVNQTKPYAPFFDCAIFTGAYKWSSAYMYILTTAANVIWTRCHVYGQSNTPNNGIFRNDLAQSTPQTIQLIDCMFDAGTNDALIKGSQYNADFAQLGSNGGNTKGLGLTYWGRLNDTTGRKHTWWTTDSASLTADADRATDIEMDLSTLTGWSAAEIASGTSLLGMDSILSGSSSVSSIKKAIGSSIVKAIY